MQNIPQEKFNIYAAIYYFLVAFFMIAAIWIFTNAERRNNTYLALRELLFISGFSVEKLAINSLENIRLIDIADKINLKGEEIINVDLVNIRLKLEDNIWVKKAVVERILPNKISILIEEHQPSAIWKISGSYHIINDKGEKITQIAESELTLHRDLIIVSGENANYHLSELFQFLDMSDQVKTKIKAAIFVSKRRWDIIMHNNMVVKLPEVNPYKSWRYFIQLNDELDLINNAVKNVDLRSDDLLFLELDPKNAKNRQILNKVN